MAALWLFAASRFTLIAIICGHNKWSQWSATKWKWKKAGKCERGYLEAASPSGFRTVGELVGREVLPCGTIFILEIETYIRGRKTCEITSFRGVLPT